MTTPPPWLDALRSVLPADSPVDLQRELAAFTRETGGADVDRFLAWLRERALLSREQYLEAQSLGRIELSDPRVARHRGGGGSRDERDETLAGRGSADELDETRASGSLERSRVGGLASLASLAARTTAAEAGPADSLEVTRDGAGAPPSPRVPPGPNDPTIEAATTQARPPDASISAITVAPGGDRSVLPGDATEGSRFDVLGVIGEGGMGRVYLAKDLDLRRKVAYKQLFPHAAMDRTVVARFLNEVQITGQLDHPNVVPVYSLEALPNGTLGYAMKLVRGKTLKELFDETLELYRKGREIDPEHTLPARLEHFLKVCDAIDFAHSKGVIHRDLKPANLMIGRYHEVYVMDWGIARLMGSESEQNLSEIVELSAHDDASEDDAGLELTRVGQMVGTPRYMSPEQANGKNKELDGRSDQYSLGIILFELVTLKRAVSGDNTMGVLTNVLRAKKEPLTPAHRKVPVPAELRAIIGKATAADPEARYATVGSLAEDVRRFLRGDEVRARPDNPAQKALRWTSRHREATLLIFVLAVLAALVPSLYSEYRRNREQLAAAEKQRTVSAFLTLVSRQSHRIDTRFLQLEEALEGLATAATWAITRGAESDEPVYFHEDYNTPGREPPDLTDSQLYRVPVSVEWPVAVRAPGLSREAILPKLRRLTPIRHHLRRMFVESGTGGRIALSENDLRHFLREGGGAMDYGYLVLPEGVLYLYPGMGCTPPDYDPRIRPYYTLAAHKQGKHWGNPYVDSSTDATGDDLVLPCATSMYDEKGEFLGVAVVECIFNKIIEQLLMMPYAPAVKRTILADGEGRVIVNSLDLNMRFVNDELERGLDLKPYGVAEVVEAVKARRSGYLETTVAGKARIIAHFRLETIGWYFVVEADPGELRGE